jgi:hypothetical protein
MIRAATIAMFCLQAAAQEPSSCAIGGVITDDDTNKPVERVRVIVHTDSYSLLTLTNGHGAFCFGQLTPGEYRLIAQKTGYLELLHSVKLAVEPDSQLNPLALRMTRYGSVSGMVLDENGELVPGVTVTLFQRKRRGPEEVEDTTADVRGTFHIAQLDPGTYYLSAKIVEDQEPRSDLAFADNHGRLLREKEAETFYPASFSTAGAAPVEVKAGQRVDNLMLTLRKMHLRRVTGTIVNPPPASFLMYSGETETRSDGYGAIPIAKDGTFAKLDLPPAKYAFVLSDGRKAIARKNVDLTVGDALNITLDPIETSDIPVIIRTEGKGPAFHPRLGWPDLMLVQDRSDDAFMLEAAADGSYRFPGVTRGFYQLHTELMDRKLYLKKVIYDGEIQTRDKVDLRAGRPGGLEITVSYNVAEVQGKVTISEGEADDLTVLLVSGTDIVHETHTDQKGRFQMPAVAPGKYRLFAIDGFDDDDWGSPELVKELVAKSVEIDLKENEKKQVSMTPISADEWAAAVKKFGG